jgi:hypothetical protein
LSVSVIPSKLAIAFVATTALSPLEKLLIISAGLRQSENAKSVSYLAIYLNNTANSDVI